MLRATLALATLLTLVSVGRAAEPEVPRADDLELRLRQLAARTPGRFQVDVIGRSAGGHPLVAVTVPARAATDSRTIYVLGGLDGQRPAGTMVLLGLIEKLRTEAMDLPDDVQLRIVPCANPDGLQTWQSRPLSPRVGNDGRLDDDRDWREDEDGPNDLDGDGRILWMRVRDPEGTYVADPAEPRLLRPAKSDAGEVGEFLLLSEGVDDDGDGPLNEDGPGGANPGENFPYGFEQFRDSAGRYSLELPEARAVSLDLLAHPRTTLVLVIGNFDNVTRKPETGKPPGGFPRKPATKMQPEDLPAHQKLTELFRGALELDEGKGAAKFPAGDPTGYAYFQLGVPTLSHPLWSTPPAEPTGEGDEKKDEGEKPKKAAPKLDESLADDAKWLAHADRHPDLGGFVPWQRIEHPRYGEVEIGGFAPGFREVPPADHVERLTAGVLSFLTQSAGLLPRITIDGFRAESRGGGVFRIEAVVRNRGELPVHLRQGSTSRHVLGTRARLEVPGGSFLSGEPIRRIPTLDPGGAQRLEWFVVSRRGATIQLEVTTALAGEARESLQLDARRESF